MSTGGAVTERLAEQIRSILAVHVDNRADVPRILKLIMLTIREETSRAKYDEINGKSEGP